VAAPRAPRGVVLPSPVVMLTIIAIAMATVAFFITRDGEPAEREIATPVGQAESTSAPTTAAPKVKKKKPIKRDQVAVEVFNNTGIQGLAAGVADQITTIGWNVVGTDNWLGTVDRTTLYYPKKLKRAAKLLALDIGIDHLAEAEGATKQDRLTLVLNAELDG